jgi:histidine triad (HIT) family protein
MQHNVLKIVQIIFMGRGNMLDQSCIFCKIITKTIPSTIIKETDDIIIIQDIAPKAPTHYLILPKKHIESVAYLTDADSKYSEKLFAAARDVATEKNIKAFNIVINNGAGAGQAVFHLHLHFLAGKNIYADGLSL